MAVDIKGLQIMKLRRQPTIVEPGGASTGTVSLASAVPKAGSANVSLTSSSASVTVPATLTIPGGAYNATFIATAKPTAAKGEAASIGASMGNTTVAPVIVQIQGSQVKYLYIPALYAGNQAQGRVDMDVPSGLAAKINLSNSSPDVTVPASVSVPSGQYSISFPISVRPSVAQGSPITISAARDGNGNSAQQISRNIELVPVRSIGALSPIKVGQTVTATVALDGNSETGGAVVLLTAYEDQPGMGTIRPQKKVYLQIPASVTVPAGQNTVAFPVTGSLYDGTKIYIGAKRSGTTTEKLTSLLTINQ
jgi:hypothetical protein